MEFGEEKQEARCEKLETRAKSQVARNENRVTTRESRWLRRKFPTFGNVQDWEWHQDPCHPECRKLAITERVMTFCFTQRTQRIRNVRHVNIYSSLVFIKIGIYRKKMTRLN